MVEREESSCEGRVLNGGALEYTAETALVEAQNGELYFDKDLGTLKIYVVLSNLKCGDKVLVAIGDQVEIPYVTTEREVYIRANGAVYKVSGEIRTIHWFLGTWVYAGKINKSALRPILNTALVGWDDIPCNNTDVIKARNRNNRGMVFEDTPSKELPEAEPERVPERTSEHTHSTEDWGNTFNSGVDDEEIGEDLRNFKPGPNNFFEDAFKEKDAKKKTILVSNKHSDGSLNATNYERDSAGHIKKGRTIELINDILNSEQRDEFLQRCLNKYVGFGTIAAELGVSLPAFKNALVKTGIPWQSLGARGTKLAEYNMENVGKEMYSPRGSATVQDTTDNSNDDKNTVQTSGNEG